MGPGPVLLGLDGRNPVSEGMMTEQALVDLLTRLDASCSGRLGVAAHRLGADEKVRWHDEDRFRTASTVKVAIHAAVMAKVRAGHLDLDRRVPLRLTDLVGGAGVLNVLRPGLEPTLADLCTLMIVISDNTATNLVIDLVGGVDAVNGALADLGFGEVVLQRRLAYPPPPLVAGPRPAPGGPIGTFATATPASLCRLVAAIEAGAVVDPTASRLMFDTLAHQHFQTGVARSFLEITEPGGTPERWPAVASKTGEVAGCRAEVGVISLPGGTRIAYAVMADDLVDTTLTSLSEGNELLGRVGAALLRRWWQGPGAPPLRPGSPY
jgi:beta-lactamase class A